jgi:hypothetical protein
MAVLQHKVVLRNAQTAQMQRFLGHHAALTPDEIITTYQTYHEQYFAALPTGTHTMYLLLLPNMTIV